MKFFSLILAILIGTLSFAQDNIKAKEILKNVADKYKTYPAISVDFVFTMDNAQEDISESSKGQAWMKGEKYKVILMGVETYFNGELLWSYMPDAEEVNLSSPEPGDKNTFDPSSLFTSYEEGYKIRYINEMFEHNRALHIIDLLPKTEDVKTSDFSRIKLKIDKDKNQIYQIIRYGKDGSDYTLTLSQLTVKKNLNDSMFIYDNTKHPEVELIDLRD